MTIEQIEYVLTAKGYSMNQWTDLKDISQLAMNGMTNIPTSESEYRFFFDSATNIILISIGTVDSQGVFTSNKGEVYDPSAPGFDPSDYEMLTPESFVNGIDVCGILNSTYFGPYGTYYTRSFSSYKK
jgi:hypothetical protein